MKQCIYDNLPHRRVRSHIGFALEYDSADAVIMYCICNSNFSIEIYLTLICSGGKSGITLETIQQFMHQKS